MIISAAKLLGLTKIFVGITIQLWFLRNIWQWQTAKVARLLTLVIGAAALFQYANYQLVNDVAGWLVVVLGVIATWKIDKKQLWFIGLLFLLHQAFSWLWWQHFLWLNTIHFGLPF